MVDKGRKQTSTPQVFALVDCSNFFVSCERLFRPDLEGEPVVVLSSGDGCAVARSEEAKQLGIPMGAPVFKHRQKFSDHGVVQFSANFELYGDISRRITEILATVTPRLEVYSIDESFLDISQLDIVNYEAWGREVKRNILKWVGIPVRVGIAPTKTLAKLASERVKKHPEKQDVLHLTVQGPTLYKHLGETPIEDVWGVGRAMTPKLRAMGLSSAKDLADLMPPQGRSIFKSVFGERLVRELRGESCYPLEQLGKAQKMISATRTFGEDTDQTYVIESALASFAARAANRLRQQNLAASKVSIFLTTNRHKPGYKRFHRELDLSQPTVDTGQLTSVAVEMFNEIHTPKTEYHRGGLTLSKLSQPEHLQVDLFGSISEKQLTKDVARMKAVDKINAKHGAAFIRTAAEDLSKSWEPKHNLRSPRYTTQWYELPKAKIS